MTMSSARTGATAGIVGAIACTTIFAFTIGLTYPLLSFVLERAGHSEFAIGFNSAMTPLGILLASPLYPRIIARFGAWQVAAFCLAASGAVIAAMGFTQSFVAFLILRFLLGVVDVGVYIVSETWINQLARPEYRGRIIGLYATSLSAGFGAGPLVLSFTGVEGYLPFALGAGFCILAIPVVLAIRGAAPPSPHSSAVSSWSFLKLAPTLLFAIMVFAFWESALLSLFPVYGMGYGLEISFVTIALSACILGNTFLQVPLGWLADVTSRRGMMIACAGLAAIGVTLLPHVTGSPILLLAVLFVWGALGGGIYTMAMTELGDRFTGNELVAGNAAFAVAYGVGGIIGGPSTGLAMDVAGNSGFTWSIAAVFALLAAYAWWRRHSAATPFTSDS